MESISGFLSAIENGENNLLSSSEFLRHCVLVGGHKRHSASQYRRSESTNNKLKKAMKGTAEADTQ
jgi:hypothetical protein